MNLKNKKFVKYNNNKIKVVYEKSGIRIINETNKHGFLVYPHLYNGRKHKSLFVDFKGETIKGNGAIFQILNTDHVILSEDPFNSASTHSIDSKNFLFAVKINGNSEVFIENINIEFLDNIDDVFNYTFNRILKSNNDILIVTPSYPTEENKYFGGFVHSRVKAYKESGLNFDLVCSHEYSNDCNYNFDGIDVTRTNFYGLRRLLTKKRYKTVLLHFFDEKYARILDACDMSQTNLFFWIHGPETLYWDWSKMTDTYFTPESELSDVSIKEFKNNDKIIKRYNEYPNVHWVFVSNWIKDRSEELINIKFNNSTVIPNFIDEENFDYIEKDINLRKKIFFIRRFENISKYAIDIDVRAILELSNRDFFDDLEFNIYGTGEYYDTLIAPLEKFNNVKLHKEFLTHTDIAKIHKENGIGLFATRYDAQGVSMCEAAISGLAIVSSQNDAIAEFLPADLGILCDTEDYLAYANVIEKMYKSPDYFLKVSEACHNKVFSKCKFDETISKEIKLIKSIPNRISNFEKTYVGVPQKVLSVIIPAYNVSDYLFHLVHTILDHQNGNKIEIIIVNDGSKDNTLDLANEIKEAYSDNDIVIVNKENGGHGSTINQGLKFCTGKYIRIIDGDDWVNTDDMCKLIDVLASETSDIIITDYSEDRAPENILVEKKLYTAMIPGKTYKFDDLCYDGYGFSEWGPILATANFKNNILKDSIKLSEKSFYVDMEFDAYSIAKANTITYYPFDVYRYFIGRVNQSISQNSYKKNYKQHENVIFKLIDFYNTAKISENKKNYILQKLILPMIIAHYVILIQFLKSGKKYYAFEKKLSKYPNIYNNAMVATKAKRFYRKTHGIFVKFDKPIRKLASILFKKR